MILLPLDEAYCFDVLTVFDVKMSKNRRLSINFKKYSEYIVDQIGEKLFHKIIDSDEYKDLYNVNMELFNMFDFVKTEAGKETTAVFVDKINYKRFEAKKKLQEKFFSSPLTEVKLGYEQK